jgi:hypothetical protein
MTRYVIDVPTLVHLVDHPPGPYRTRPLSRPATLSLRTITPPARRPRAARYWRAIADPGLIVRHKPNCAA